MEPINFQISIAIIMLAVTVAMIAWFYRNKANHSLRRRTRMMTRIGLDPETTDQQTLATMKAVTARCSVCNCEDYCERWLDGEVDGSNDFCPNAQTFQHLKLSAESESRRSTAAHVL